jgi:hypothetical protein
MSASAAATISISCFDLAALHRIPSIGLEAHGLRVGRQDLRPSTILVTASYETSFKALIMVVSALILVASAFDLFASSFFSDLSNMRANLSNTFCFISGWWLM